jgi:aminopeptidase N
MDMANDDYRERVNKAFQLHERSPVKNFEYFYQSQILWDETMAHSIAQFLNDHPDFQMVVLAGEQHVMFSSGIPKRTSRLTGKDYATLINGIPEEVDANVGDFVLFPDSMTLPVSPRLGVLLQEEEGKIRVKDILPGSVATQAGIRKDDAVISVDDWKIESIEDIKIALFDKKVGETVTVKVLRKRFLRRDKEIEFKVTL